jgi:hypothetical protein
MTASASPPTRRSTTRFLGGRGHKVFVHAAPAAVDAHALRAALFVAAVDDAQAEDQEGTASPGAYRRRRKPTVGATASCG